MDFANVYAQGFVRVAACSAPVEIADPASNAATVAGQARRLAADGVGLAVFPEMFLTGYAIDDLVLSAPVLDAAEEAIAQVARETGDLPTIIVVGAPLRCGARLLNCAVIIHRGQLLGVSPKTYLPTYREFYEKRYYASGAQLRHSTITLAGKEIPIGPDLLFEAVDVPGFVLHAEVCEDSWVPIPPSREAVLAGATVLANCSSSPISISRAGTRHDMCRSASAHGIAGYVYAASGEGESTTDLAWDGQAMVYEHGRLLAGTSRFPRGPQAAVADIDLRLLAAERLRAGTFDDNAAVHAERVSRMRRIRFEMRPPAGDLGLRRTVERFPFVPADPGRLAQDCYEAYAIQVSGLEQRLRAIGQPKIVIGVSGGLDSTQALIVAARALDRLGRPRSDILACTMPGFATSARTRGNAQRLAEALGASFRTLDIRPAAIQMLADIGHPYRAPEPGAADTNEYDVTFENVQAGLRTDYLFRLANHNRGIVLGTGDLSELALGWCTYGVGDHMSHYNVNAGVPKTLIQHLIRWVISSQQFEPEVSEVLRSILGTEITPELVPVRDGEAPQSTEGTIGPYALHDFTLWHVLGQGAAPSRIAFLAWHAWHDAAAGRWPAGIGEEDKTAYDLAAIRSWLEVFCRRFFGFSQFKRSAVPNGPKVSIGGSLSPRGDWRAPSDGNARVWLAELAANVPTSWPKA